ncbi:hypothetical protein HYPSUDRAFT_41595 [Hypholoma sublateritium FD-334 SS-4]|uniref:Uncharacterized protein n=1 Tax=Hypholoma sublateritium (strain FD-334 SS-4) TaxID=945553 RepID=A0A0D2PPF3_HYPSF|nr:hypothetical protein HYPSUDRAFT_41595 [Hypholoma sublateritium FD-334 SS-4]
MSPPPVISPPFAKDAFTLDVSGIAGFFGGEEAFAAMLSVHLIPARRWMGWYNSPGSYFVAKKYGTLPNSTFWDGLFPGPAIEPTKLLELDSGIGLRYTGVYSGTQLYSTGHLSYLLSSYCKTHRPSPAPYPIAGRDDPPPDTKSTATSHMEITLPKQDKPPQRNITITIARFPKLEEWPDYPAIPSSNFANFTAPAFVFILLTILFSLAGAVLCGLYGDWYSFSMIIFGVVANGITCTVLGAGVLTLEMRPPSPKSPPGDGILFDSENIILLQGEERVISGLLHSRMTLRYADDPRFLKIGFCSILLLAQFLAQLFLVPQGKLVGQILFLSTLALSWICNGYLASFDSEELQRDLLFKLLRGPELYKFPVTRWSTAVAFAVLYHAPRGARGILDELMPNNTPAWALWKDCLCASVEHKCSPSAMINGPDTWVGGLLHGNTAAAATAAPLQAAFHALPPGEQGFIKDFLSQADDVFDSVARVNDTKFCHAEYDEKPVKSAGYRKQSVTATSA